MAAKLSLTSGLCRNLTQERPLLYARDATRIVLRGPRKKKTEDRLQMNVFKIPPRKYIFQYFSQKLEKQKKGRFKV